MLVIEITLPGDQRRWVVWVLQEATTVAVPPSAKDQKVQKYFRVIPFGIAWTLVPKYRCLWNTTLGIKEKLGFNRRYSLSATRANFVAVISAAYSPFQFTSKPSSFRLSYFFLASNYVLLRINRRFR